MDFSIQGKATPRHPTGSARTSAKPPTKSGTTTSIHSTPGALRPPSGRPHSGRPPSARKTQDGVVGVISQSELERQKKEFEINAGGDGDAGRHSRMMEKPPKPQSIPSLNLGRLADYDNALTRPNKDYTLSLDTPDSASTVSWGTLGQGAAPYAYHYTPAGKNMDRAQPKPVSAKKKKSTVWDQAAVPENLPPPSQRYKQKYQEYKEDIKNQYQQYSNKEQPQKQQQQQQQQMEHSKEKNVEEQRKNNKQTTDEKVDLNEEDSVLNTSWGNAYSQQHQNRKRDAEELLTERRKQQVVETCMIDQLSRAVISDPEQNVESAMGGSSTPYGHPVKSRIRTLHQSKIRTTKTATETLLSKRLNFGARILTRNGRDAHRELCGFFFAYDNTLTVYEFRQFGKKSSALPLIQRGTYTHQTGRKRGQEYTIRDVSIGQNLTFVSSEQASLPESLAKQKLIVIRIIDVDIESKEKLVFGATVPIDAQDYNTQMMPSVSKEECEDMKVLANVQSQVRKQLKKRGSKTVTGLGRHFGRLDQTGDGILSQSELKEALRLYHIDIPPQDFERVWTILDENNDGGIDYGEFARGVIGEMSEYRKLLVRKALHKLDPNKAGVIRMSDMSKFFSAQRHPQVLAGQAQFQDILKSFLDSFEHCKRSGEVTYVDFEDYYEGLSISIDNKDDFTNMMKNCWGI